MATTRFLTRSLLTTTTKGTSATAFLRSYTSLSLSISRSPPLPTNFPLLRLRYLAAANIRLLTPAYTTTVRAFATRQTSSSLSDPNPNWSNRPPKETILLDGCDFEHWLVVMEKPEGDPTRDEIIDSYIKTLSQVVGSEEEARMKIYSVSTRHYFAFGALVSEELSYKLKELPRVRWVLPDSYLDVKNKDYGGEPFINGQAVPYDPKYHEEWVRNNARANERNRRNDRPRNFDRSRNFERRRDMQQGPPSNMGRPNPGSNMAGGPPGNPGSPYPMHNTAGGPPGGMGPPPNMALAPNAGGMPPNMSGGQPSNVGVPPSYSGGVPPNNMSGVPPNNMAYQSGPTPNQSSFAPNAAGNYQNHNMPYQSGPAPNQSSYGANTEAGNPYQNQNMHYQSGPAPNQSSYGANTAGGNPYQGQTMNGRDMPPPPNYR